MPSLEHRRAEQTSEKSNWLQGIPQRDDAAVGYVLALDAQGYPVWSAPTGGGSDDHGALAGLADDDHTQYQTEARGDARYWRLSTDLATQAELDAVAAAKANTAHTHSAADIASGTLDDARIPAGIARDAEVTAAVAAHEAAADPHTGYQRESEKSQANGYASLGADGKVPAAELPASGGGLTFDQVWPVGSVFIAVVSTNPATLLGAGTWQQIAGGRMLVGQTGGDADFDTAEETGGAKTHTLTAAEMPAHVHNQTRLPTTTGGVTGFTVDTSMSGTPATSGVDTGSVGGGGAHNNMPPYLVVYIWKRTA
jgi:hypothetical protein